MKRKKLRIRVLWWSLGQAIFFGLLLLITILGIIFKIYPLALVSFFCVIYGNLTMLLGQSVGANQEYADKNVNGSNKFGDYDGKVDAYIERDYK